MKRVGKWLDRGKLHVSASTQSLDSLAEAQSLEQALQAVDLMMNDDIQGADEGLAQGNSPFHKLCKGMILFMKATLGFEQDIMKEAAEQLAAAESSAYAEQHKAQKDNRAFRSGIYDKGTEFALCQAEAQIMSAVIAVLNESLTESIRGFYKVRKAYMTLNSIMQMEATYLKSQGNSLANSRSESVGSTAVSTPTTTHSPTTFEKDATHANLPSGLRQTQNASTDDAEDNEDEFYDVSDDIEDHNLTLNYTGHLESANGSASIDKKSEDAAISNQDRLDLPSNKLERLSSHASYKGITKGITLEAESDIFANPLDVFIHSGANLWFGLLSLMISVIPPSFSRLLYIIGFRGEKERGLRMLWQATKFPNINGGMASLMIMGWYNGLVGFCDIKPDPNPLKPNDMEGYPSGRLQTLLKQMRTRYPQSQLWIIEEARMEASHRHLDRTLALLADTPKTQMKQLSALHMFEKGMCAMAAKEYQLCSDSFMICVDLNTWSQALYYYIAGAAQLACYRSMQSIPEKAEEAEKHKKLAEEYFKTATTKTGKKKMMGRQLPFDVFVNRKITKWEERATARKCSFIDAIVVSPLEEMCFLWSLYKRMNEEQLQISLENLAWSESSPYWDPEDHDERAILAVLRAIVLRNLRRHDEAMELLKSEIICYDPQLFKGGNKDDWAAPTAHFEMGVNLWMMRKQYIKQYGTGLTVEDNPVTLLDESDISHDARLVNECRQWVTKAKGWDRYILQERQGMKVTVALEAVRKWEQQHGTGKK